MPASGILRTQLRRSLEGGRGSRGRSSRGCLGCGGLEVGGDRLISLVGDSRTMPDTAGGLIDDGGQSPVGLGPLAAARGAVGGRAHKRVAERDRVLDLHEAGILGVL